MITEKTFIYHEKTKDTTTIKRKHFTKKEKQQIISELNTGISKQELLTKYNISITTLNRWLKELNKDKTTIQINKNQTNLKIEINTSNNKPPQPSPNINIYFN